MSGGVPALYAMKMMCGDRAKVYAATDDMLYTCYDLGADGAISAILAVFPRLCVEMWECSRTAIKPVLWKSRMSFIIVGRQSPGTSSRSG
ncbi:MAG: hypothetical protein V8S96_00375 [Lachnospiraceae bacterium]